MLHAMSQAFQYNWLLLIHASIMRDVMVLYYNGVAPSLSSEPELRPNRSRVVIYSGRIESFPLWLAGATETEYCPEKLLPPLNITTVPSEQPKYDTVPLFPPRKLAITGTGSRAEQVLQNRVGPRRGEP